MFLLWKSCGKNVEKYVENIVDVVVNFLTMYKNKK